MSKHTTIGGSEVASILGISPREAALALWCRKKGLIDGPEETEPMLWGRVLESAVTRHFRALHKEYVVRKPAPVTRGWKRASPDALLFTDGQVAGGLEVKTAGARMTHLWEEQVPPEVDAQCRWYMHVLEVPFWWVAVLVGGQEYGEVRLERDAEREQEMVATVEHFKIAHLDTDIPPEPAEPYKSSLAALQKAWTPKDADLVTPPPEILDAILRLAKRREALKVAEEVIERLETVVKYAIKDGPGFVGPWGKVTWRASRNSERTDWETIAKEAGASQELIGRHTAIVPGARRFLVNVKEVSDGAETGESEN